MSKLKVTTISDPDNDNTAITVDTSGNVTFSQNATFSGTVTGVESLPDAIDVNASAPADTLKIDASGRITTPSQVGFKAYGHNVSPGTSGIINFKTAVFNNGSHYNTTSGRFTAPVDGHYLFTSEVLLQQINNEDDDIHVRFRINGSAGNWFNVRAPGESAASNYVGYSGYLPVIGTTIVKMSANDYMEVVFSATGSIQPTDSEDWCYLSGWLLG